MEQLINTSNILTERTSLDFIRYIYDKIDWNNRLTGIAGSRGVGKTTLILQNLKQVYGVNPDKALYVSLDSFWFMSHSLWELADTFHKNGGIALYVDEVHKYPNWSAEIKNIYDSFPDMKIVFTGSSMLDISRSAGDLSRRARKYKIYGMSFREFLEYEYGLEFEPYSLEDILTNHVSICQKILNQIKPIAEFGKYLRNGYFPFYKEDREGYLQRLSETVNAILEVDIPANMDIEYATILKLKRLFSLVSRMVPFTPNISDLAKQIETTRPSLLKYLGALEQANALMLLDKQAKGLKGMVKPEKIYLGNTNYAYAFSSGNPDIGNLRETFFYSMLRVNHDVLYSDKTDFYIDEKFSFEIGGKNKGQSQISGLENAFVVKDDIESGYGNVIPLWLFGFLY